MPFNWDAQLPAPAWQQSATPQAYWEKKLERARATPPAGLFLGSSLSTSLPVFLTPEILRTHMHVLGSTGVGKSFFLEAAIKSLILQGYGVALLDPHGDLYHRILSFCAWLSIQKPQLQLHRRVVPFDVAETQNIIGFNPVARNARVMTYQVVALMESIRKCWSQDSFADTPRLARWLFNVAYALISADVTFIQAQHMVNPAPDTLRTAITGRISNPRIRAEWEWLESMKVDKREERIESTLNRIKPFVEHEIIRPIMGQYTKTLDFPGILHGSKILLVNLARQNAISEDNQHLLRHAAG
jgi:Helicase HerA, central domain